MPVQSEVTESCLTENPGHLAADPGPFLDRFPRKICPQQVAVLKRQAEGLLKAMETNLL